MMILRRDLVAFVFACLAALAVARPASAFDEDVRPGCAVDVGVRVLAGGALVAEDVEVAIRGEDLVAVKGEVQSVHPDTKSVVILGIPVSIPDTAMVRGMSGKGSFKDVRVGKRVKVEGSLGEGGLVAERVNVMWRQRRSKAGRGSITARLDSIDLPNRTLVVMGKTIALTPRTEWITEFQPMSALIGANVAHESGTGAALVRRFSTWTDDGIKAADPGGVTCVPGSGDLLVCDSEVEDFPVFTGNNMFRLNRKGAWVRSYNTLPYTKEPTGIAFHAKRKTYFITDDDKKKVIEVNPEGEVVGRIDPRPHGCRDIEGITYNPKTKSLWVVDGAAGRVVEMDAEGGLKSRFYLKPLGITDAEGVACHPETGHLFFVSTGNLAIFEVTPAGKLAATFSVAYLGALAPGGLCIGPASDGEGVLSAYIADAMLEDAPDGVIHEVSLARRPADAAFQTSLVGDRDGFGFKGDEAGFAAADWNDNGTLEVAELLPDLDGKAGIYLHAGADAFDNRTEADSKATDTSLLVTPKKPVKFVHGFDLGGKTPVWARLTIVLADVRTLPGARNEVWIGGEFQGEVFGAPGVGSSDGAITATHLYLPPRLLAGLQGGTLEVEIRRPASGGTDDIAIDYSSLEIAVTPPR